MLPVAVDFSVSIEEDWPVVGLLRYWLLRGLRWLFDDPRLYDEGDTIHEVPSDRLLRVGPGRRFRLLEQAWAEAVRLAPMGGCVIEVDAGRHPADPTATDPTTIHLTDFRGTASTPILIRGGGGRDVEGDPLAVIAAEVNVARSSFVYLMELTVRPPTRGDEGASEAEALHVDASSDILVRGCTIDGRYRLAPPTTGERECLKGNQCRRLFVEQCNIRGGSDNALEFVAVQDGHLIANRIHDSGGWAAYVKGGSAHLRVEGNEFYDSVHGFSLGEGTGLNYTVAPFVHYEAYGVRFVNNIIRHIRGAAVGVSGAFNVLVAYNTMYRVGWGDFGGGGSNVFQVGFGRRGCDYPPGSAGAAARTVCENRLRVPRPGMDGDGAWGTTCAGQEREEPIPNRDVLIYNNLVVNPDDAIATDGQLKVVGERDWLTPPCDDRRVPPGRGDENLRVEGNLIWNGSRTDARRGSVPVVRLLEHVEVPVGPEEPDGTRRLVDVTGCRGGTCTEDLLDENNAVNRGARAPQLADPASHNYRPLIGGNLFTERAWREPPARAPRATLPSFSWTRPAGVPTGAAFAPAPAMLANEVPIDRDRSPRGADDPPGAYNGRWAESSLGIFVNNLRRVAGLPPLAARERRLSRPSTRWPRRRRRRAFLLFASR